MPWHAIYTKPRWEKKVVKLLTEKSIDNYCPMKIVVRQWKDRKVKIEQPLLSSYVFVNIPEADITKVLVVDGVVRFLYFDRKLAVIKDKEIEQLKEFTTKHTGIVIQNLKDVVGKKILVPHGPFIGKKATISAIRKNKIELVIESLGVRLVVEKE